MFHPQVRQVELALAPPVVAEPMTVFIEINPLGLDVQLLQGQQPKLTSAIPYDELLAFIRSRARS